MKGIYKFYWDCGRAGDLEGVFVADDSDVAKVLGEEVYFGEVLGKHSEIVGTLDDGDLTLVSTDPAFVELFEKHKLTTGHNPIERYLEDVEDEED